MLWLGSGHVPVKGWILAELLLKAVHERMVKCNVNSKMYAWCIRVKVYAVQCVGAPSTINFRMKGLIGQPDAIMISSFPIALAVSGE